MPFNTNLKAKTGADANDGLYCFIPSIAAIFNEGTHIDEKDRMALAFKNYYKINGPFSRDTLRGIIQNTRCPIEREALLAPVLREMLVDRMRRANLATDPLKSSDDHIAQISNANRALSSSDLLYLADDLGILLEAYDPQNNSLDTLRDRKNNVLAFSVKPYAHAHVLKVKNDSVNWGFERVWNKDAAENKRLLDEHNAKYEDNLTRFNTEALRHRVKAEVEAGRICLSPIFAEPEIFSKKASKAAVNDSLGGMVSKVGGFMQNLFGDGAAKAMTAIKDTIGGIARKAGNVMKGISAALPAIKDKIGGIASGLGNVVNSLFSGSGSKSGQIEGLLSGLFKLFADLFKTIMGIFGQAASKTNVKSKVETPKPRSSTASALSGAMSSAASSLGEYKERKDVAESSAQRADLKVDSDKPGDLLAQRFQDSVNNWTQGFAREATIAAATPAPGLSSSPQSVQIPPVHLAQFKTSRSEPLHSRAANASPSAKNQIRSV